MRLSQPVRALGIVTVVTVLLALLMVWFSWPAKEMEPRDLPVVVAGPPSAAAAFAEQLGQASPGAFDVTVVADEAAADAALADREAYAAFLVGPAGLTVHTASAAGPAVATLVSAMAQQSAAASGQAVRVTDVVAGTTDDPRGTGFNAGFLPLVLVGLLAAVALYLLVSSRWVRLLGVACFAVFTGLLGGAVLHWFGLVSGEYLSAAAAIGLLALAVSAAVAGLGALLGPAGLALGVLVIFLFGNPISAIPAAPEMLPQPWGEVGQFLPVGAGAALLRSAAFFDWAGAARPLLVLGGWSVVGLLFLLVGRTRVSLRAFRNDVGASEAGSAPVSAQA